LASPTSWCISLTWADGRVFAVAALTESEVPAAIQPAAEAVMGEVARGLHDQLRRIADMPSGASDQRSSGNVAGSGLAVSAGRPEACQRHADVTLS
jgi:hypothetical protein